MLDRISKCRADLIFRFTQDTFGVDGYPTSLGITQNVAVMEVAMQQAPARLRCTQFHIHHVSFVDELLRKRLVVTCPVPFETFSPLFGGWHTGTVLR